MTSDEILQRLLALHPKRIDLSLHRLFELLEALDNPHLRVPPVIHVAGTNGKGSVCAYLRAGLEASGARVHVYSSPHLVHFHERIRLAGAFVAEERLSDALKRCEDANEGRPITCFEITTAAAFVLFAEEPADWLVLEVGLGGRLDATNVVERPAATAITAIAIDHQEFLGETLGEIALEKAGILKSTIPAVVATQAPEAEAAITQAAETVGAQLLLEGRDWSARREQNRIIFEDSTGLLDLPPPVLLGPHQVGNAGIALTLLRHLGVDDEACAAALTNAEWPARLQRLKDGPIIAAASEPIQIWLDGGHNPAAARALAQFFAEQEEKKSAPLYLICGMLTNKDAVAFLSPFAGLVRRVYAVAIDGEPSGYAAENLAQHAISAGLQAEAAGSSLQAIRSINAEVGRTKGNKGARVLMCGSLYLAGRILRENG